MTALRWLGGALRGRGESSEAKKPPSTKNSPHPWAQGSERETLPRCRTEMAEGRAQTQHKEVVPLEEPLKSQREEERLR